MNSIIRILLLSILILNPYGRIFSQADTTGYPGESDTLQNFLKPSKHILYAASGIGSTPLFPGSVIDQNQKFAYSAIMYGFKNKLYLSASGFKMMENDLLSDFLSYSVNYTHGFGNWFDISLTAARFQFLNVLTDAQMNSFFYSDISAGINFSFFSTDIDWSGLFSAGENRYYYQIRNSGYFQTRSFFHGKAYLSFNPYVNIMFGSRLQSNTDIITTALTTYDTVTLVNPSAQPVTDLNGNRIYSAPSGQISNSTTIINSSTIYSSTEQTTYSKIFSLLEVNFGLPVAINFRNLTFEAEAGYVIPFYSDIYMPRSNGFVFLFSVYFKIFQ